MDANKKELLGGSLFLFNIDHSEFGIALDCILEVIYKPEIDDIPNKPAFLSGVCRIRDSIIPIINLSNILSIGEVYPDEDYYVVILNISDYLLGFVIEKYSKIYHIDQSGTDFQDSTLDNFPIMYVQTIINLMGKLVTILDIDAIYKYIMEMTRIPDYLSLEEISAQKEIVESEESQKYLTFFLSDQHFGISIEFVQEVLDFQDVSKVFHTPAFILGVTNFRGTILPIFDIRSFFNLTSTEFREELRLIIVEMNGKKSCIVVDRVRGIINIALKEIIPIPDSVRINESPCLMGIIDDSELPLILIDLEKMFADERIARLGN